MPALLKGVSKTYWQAAGSSGGAAHSHSSGTGAGGSVGHPAGSAGGSDGAVHAVQGLWLSIGRQQQPSSSSSGSSDVGGNSNGSSGNGECFGLLGVNGAGKTTTFKMLTGALPLLPAFDACQPIRLPTFLLNSALRAAMPHALRAPTEAPACMLACRLKLPDSPGCRLPCRRGGA